MEEDQPWTVDNLLKLSRRLARALSSHRDPCARDLNAAVFRLDRCLSGLRDSYTPPPNLLWIDDVGTVLDTVFRHLRRIESKKSSPNYSTTMSSEENTEPSIPNNRIRSRRLHHPPHHNTATRNQTLLNPNQQNASHPSTLSSQQNQQKSGNHRRPSIASIFSAPGSPASPPLVSLLNQPRQPHHQHLQTPHSPSNDSNRQTPANQASKHNLNTPIQSNSRRLFSSFSRLLALSSSTQTPIQQSPFTTAARTVDEWVAAVCAARDDFTDRDAESCISLSDALPPLPQQYAPCRDAVYHAARDALLSASLRTPANVLRTTSSSTSTTSAQENQTGTPGTTSAVTTDDGTETTTPTDGFTESRSVASPVTTVALVGAHGVGKTLLAMEMVQDVDVCHNFADGVAWLQLGPDITDEELADALTHCVDTIIAGDFRSTVRYCDSLDAVVSRARRLLRHVSALIVIDDVSGPRGWRAFDIVVSTLGPLSVALYTQPLDERAAALAALSGLIAQPPDDPSTRPGVKCVARLLVHPLDPSGTEATTVFRSWLTSTTSEESRDGSPRHASDQEAIIAKCHGLPLALAMAAGFMSKFHDNWTTLSAALAGCDSGDDTIFRILQLLHCKGGSRFEGQLRGIGSLPEGVWVSLSTLADMWNIDYKSIKLSARRLGRMAFGEYRLSDSSDESRVRFHWHISQYCRRATSTVAEREFHRKLVRNIRRRRVEGRKRSEKVDYLPWWSGCVLDKYMCRRLHWHMLRGDMLEELSKLIIDYEWVCHRLEKDSLLGVITEFTLAMAAEEHNGRLSEAKGIGQILEVIEEAAELRSEHALEMNALPTLLMERLERLQHMSGIVGEFVRSVAAKARRPWLRTVVGGEAPPQLSRVESESSDSTESEMLPYMVNCLASTVCGKAVCGDRLGNVHVFDPATGRQVISWTNESSGEAGDYCGVGALATIGEHVVSGHLNGRVVLRSMRSGRSEVLTWCGDTGEDGKGIAMEKVTSLATSTKGLEHGGNGGDGREDDGMVAVGTNRGRVWVLVMKRSDGGGRKVKRISLEGHCGTVTSLHLFAGSDGRMRLASSSYDGFAAVWRLRGHGVGTSRVSLNGHKPDIGHKENYITTFAAIHGGKRVLSACRAGVVSAWNSERGECLWTRRYGFEFSRSASLQAFGLWHFGGLRDDKGILRVGYPYVITRGEGPCDLLILSAGEGRDVLATVTADRVISTWHELWHPATENIFIAVSHVDGNLSTYQLVTSLK